MNGFIDAVMTEYPSEYCGPMEGTLKGYMYGEVPQVGDKVKCVTYNYCMIQMDAKVTVAEVVPGASSWLIRPVKCGSYQRGVDVYKAEQHIRDMMTRHKNKAAASLFKASNFKLIERGFEMGSNVNALTAEVEYLVVDHACRIVGTANDEETLNEVVGNLLRKDPFKKYRVFNYLKTGRLPEVEIKWETASSAS